MEHGPRLGRPGGPGGAKQELQGGRLGELGRAPEPAVGRVVGGGHRPVGGRREAGGGNVAGRGERGGEALGEVGGRRDDLLSAVLPPLVDGGEHAGEGGQPGPLHFGEVGAAEEGLPGRGEEGSQRPSTLAGERLHRLQVVSIKVGSFLPIDLDVDEPAVHEVGGAPVGEGLGGHHVAPVARGVAHGQQDRHVAAAGLGEGLVAPLEPFDGVVGVLEEVGAGGAGEAVSGGGGHGGRCYGRRPAIGPPAAKSWESSAGFRGSQGGPFVT